MAIYLIVCSAAGQPGWGKARDVASPFGKRERKWDDEGRWWLEAISTSSSFIFCHKYF